MSDEEAAARVERNFARYGYTQPGKEPPKIPSMRFSEREGYTPNPDSSNDSSNKDFAEAIGIWLAMSIPVWIIVAVLSAL